MIGNNLNHISNNEIITLILSSLPDAKRELSLIREKGFDGRQIQFILKNLFSAAEQVYIPDIEELSNIEKLPLGQLAVQSFTDVLFAFKANEIHQVAVHINLENKPYVVSIYDSLQDATEKSFAREDFQHLQDLLGSEEEYILDFNQSPFEKQTENALCGIYAVEHLHYSMSRKAKVELNFLDNEEKRIEEYYERYLQQERNLENQKTQLLMQDFLHNAQSGSAALEVSLKNKPPECLLIHLPNQGESDKPSLLPQHVDLLKTELETSLSNKERGKYLTELLSIFFDTNLKNEIYFVSLLKAYNIAPDQYITKQQFRDYGLVVRDMYEEFKKTKDLTFENFAAVAILSYLLEQMDLDPGHYLKELTSKSSAKLLVFELFKEIVNLFLSLEIDLRNENNRLAREKKVREDNKDSRKLDIKHKFLDLNLNLTLEQCNLITGNICACIFSDRYLTAKYLENFTDSERQDLILDLISLRNKPDLSVALDLYKGESYFDLIAVHQEEIFDHEDIIKISLALQKKSYDYMRLLQQFRERITGDNLHNILNGFPEGSRVQIAIEFEYKIQNGKQLSQVTNALPESARLSFVLKNSDKIINSLELMAVIVILKWDDRPKIIFKCEYILKSDQEFNALINLLRQMPTNPLRFLQLFKAMINGNNLHEIIEKFSEEVRIQIVNEYKDTIENGKQLSRVISCLPKSVRLDFVLENFAKINNFIELMATVASLELSERYEVIIRIVSRIFVGKFAHPWANKRQKKATRYFGRGRPVSVRM